jgi:site-specific DNA recombinase
MQRRVDETRLQRGLKRADYLVPADPANYVYLSAPALVDSDLWERCQQRLIENKELLAGNPTRKYLLSGLVRCPVCGRALKSRTKKSGVYYQCLEGKPGRLAAGSSCQPTHYRADVIEQLTIRALREVVRRPELVTAALHAYSSQSDDEAVVSCEKLRAELNELHAREKATVQAQIAGIQAGADPKLYAALLAEIAAKRNALQTTLASMEKPRKDIHSEVSNLTQASCDVDTILEAKEDELSTQEKRAFLSRIIKAIHPSAQGYTIVLPPLTREEGDTVQCMSAY